jgi:hypothetical protein
MRISRGFSGVSALLVVALLSLAGCAPPAALTDEQPTFGEFHPDAAPARQESVLVPEQAWQEPYSSVTPARGAALPRASAPAIATQPVQHLPAAAFSEPFTSGPITGYGQGGMQHEPGTPHNPPWN